MITCVESSMGMGTNTLVPEFFLLLVSFSQISRRSFRLRKSKKPENKTLPLWRWGALYGRRSPLLI